MNEARILVVDDDEMVRRSCERILRPQHEVRLAETGRAGLAALAAEPFHLVLVDLKLPDLSGLEFLRQAPDAFPDVPVVIITGYSTVKSAVEAIKLGAFDYVAKPFTPEELLAVVEKALRQHRLLTDYRRLHEDLAGRYHLTRFIGEGPAMKRVFTLIEQVAATDATVLLTGESGTGKELAARAIHFSGPRHERRFVAVDCGAIAPSLMASELFGHQAGAFTGATADRTGLIQSADGGTLFLDEVPNLPLDLQAALLRVIETREVRPVGAERSVGVDVRLIAATNQDLRALVADGRFRADLFHRLNVFPIALPSLRERREDIPLLARHFLALFAARMHKPVQDFTPEAMRLLQEYDWPGNVRELSNVVERLVILTAEGPVGRAHLQESLAVPSAGAPVPTTAAELNRLKRAARDGAVQALERAFLVEALRRNGGNVSRAALETGMQRTQFQALLRKHHLRLHDLTEP
jgi:DNA-binding NtrC family response regulator